jgi:hypothetical protein
MLPVKKTAVQRDALFMVSIFLDGVTSRDESKLARPDSTPAFRGTKAHPERRFAMNAAVTATADPVTNDRMGLRRADRDEECPARGPDHSKRTCRPFGFAETAHGTDFVLCDNSLIVSGADSRPEVAKNVANTSTAVCASRVGIST